MVLYRILKIKESVRPLKLGGLGRGHKQRKFCILILKLTFPMKDSFDLAVILPLYCVLSPLFCESLCYAKGNFLMVKISKY